MPTTDDEQAARAARLDRLARLAERQGRTGPMQTADNRRAAHLARLPEERLPEERLPEERLPEERLRKWQGPAPVTAPGTDPRLTAQPAALEPQPMVAVVSAGHAGRARRTGKRRRSHRAAAARVLAVGLSLSVMFGIVTVLAENQRAWMAAAASPASAPRILTVIRHVPAPAAGAPPPSSGPGAPYSSGTPKGGASPTANPASAGQMAAASPQPAGRAPASTATPTARNTPAPATAVAAPKPPATVSVTLPTTPTTATTPPTTKPPVIKTGPSHP